MKEKLSNGETSEEQSHDNVAWEGDVYSLKCWEMKKVVMFVV